LKVTPIRAHFDLLKPSGHYMYHQFNITQFHVLPTEYNYVFCVDLRTKSYYFPCEKGRCPDCVNLTLERDRWRYFVKAVMKLWVP